jgi:hypothetical protein
MLAGAMLLARAVDDERFSEQILPTTHSIRIGSIRAGSGVRRAVKS